MYSIFVSSLLFLEFVIFFYPASTGQLVQKEKQAYLDTISHLYKVLQDHGLTTQAGQNETRIFALLGTVSDTINHGSSPRDYYIIRSYHIDYFDKNGTFSMYVTVNSLSNGEEYFHLKGIMSEEKFDAKIDKRRRINKYGYLSSQRKKKSPPFKFNASINNGSKDINDLISQCEETECANSSHGVCGRGQVVINAWLNSTLSFQRSLEADIPINYRQWIGTHNSFNNKADGYGSGGFLLAKVLNLISRGKWNFVWAQQYFTITDQLNMGVRYIMLDPVYFWGTMRLCHCGGVNANWIDSILEYIKKHLHITLDYDTGNLGCLPTDRPFATAIQEIYDWLSLPSHESEQVIIMVNDARSDFDWGHKTLIWDPIVNLLGDILLTQTEKNNLFPDSNVWPTPNQMKELGKKVIVLGTSRIVNDTVFLDVSVPEWDKDSMKYFTPYSKCGGYGPGQWYTMGGESQVVGEIYNGPKEEGLIVSENYPYVLQCPVSITKLDLISPRLLYSSVWSWKEGYSAANGQCPVITRGNNGRWTTAPCANTLCYHACRNSSNFYQISLSNTPAQWNASNTCPEQFELTVPVNGYQNWNLFSSMVQRNVTCTWINLHSKYVKHH